jgi:hypothetical protein
MVEVYRCFRGACCLNHQGAMMMEAVSSKHRQTSTDYTAQQPRRQPSSRTLLYVVS